jgi:hypothetical protein
MSKSVVNFLVDSVMFVAIMLLSATGALMRYVLPPGSGHFSQLWRMDRHQWGQIHFWIAVVLMTTVALHLLLHWHWVVCMAKGRPGKASRIRVALAVVGVLALAGLMVAPFFAQVEQTGKPPHKMQSSEASTSSELQVNGSMTLREVEEQTGVPATVILRELGLPVDLPTDEQLGRLRKKHGFEMHAIKEIVRKYHERQ